MKNPDVSIVILNYNGKYLTKDLLDSIKKIDFPKNELEIILVDNGSTDGSVEFINKSYPYVEIIANKENLGFDEGMNIGVRASRGKYVTMLNNDIIVDKNWLKELVKAIEIKENIGIVEPRIYNKKAGRYTIEDYGTTSLFQTLIFRKDVKIDTKEYVRVFTASSACLFKRNILEVPFDKDYFAYGEDTYFGWLVRLKGYEIITAPLSVIYHIGSATISKLNKKRYFNFLAERNKLLNILTFYELRTLLKIMPLLLLFILFVNLYNLKLIPIRLRAYWWVLKNFRHVLIKRKIIQAQRKVKDEEIISLMSCKFVDEKNSKNGFIKFLVGIANAFSCLYCRLVNINFFII